ncbi:extracellular solute-binding protein [bacterium]|nr:extracellular solute-binding protein [bacterium]
MKILKLVLMVIIALSLTIYLIKPKDNEQTEVSFYTLQMGTFKDYIENIISEFEKENPEIKIKWVDVPYSEGEKRALASVLSDNTPDIFNLTPDFSLTLAQKNALTFIEEETLSQFFKPLLKSVKYGEKYYAFPFYATSAVTIYNEDLMKDNSIPQNYPELFDLCLKFKQNNDYLTMISFNENDTLLKILNKYGIKEPKDLLKDESIDLFRELRNLYQSGKLPKESITQSHREGLEKYMSGQLAILNVGVNFINIIKENAPQIYEKTKIAPQLSSNHGEYDYSLMNLVIPKKSKHKEEAIKFILYLTNEKNQLDLSKLTSVLSVNDLALKDEFFKGSDENLLSQAISVSAKQLKEPIEPVKIQKNRKEIISLSSTFIQKVLISSEKIEDLVKKFSDDWEKLSV